jgi:hypothetical protein
MAIIGHHENWQRRERIYSAFQIFFTLLSLVYLFATRFSAEDVAWSPILEGVVTAAKQYVWFTVPVLGLIISLFGFLRKLGGPAVVWILVHEILNEFHKHVFENGGSVAENRVTLFRYSTWCVRGWPMNCGWLVPVERSHHLTRVSRARFKAPDNGKVRGVAGKTWETRNVVMVSRLPNISPEADAPPKKNAKRPSEMRLAWISVCEFLGGVWWLDWFWRIWWNHRKVTPAEVKGCEEYAKQTWCDTRWIIKQKRCKKSLPRSLCGIPVEVSGKMWGVIIIDSRSENLVTQDRVDEFYRRHGKLLEKSLKHA